MKRKREAGDVEGSSMPKPAAGTVVYSTGKAVKAGLAGGSRQALVAFTQQISTPQSKLPLPLNSPAVVILQQYLDVSAVYEEVFDAWNEGDKRRDEKQVEAAVHLLAQIIRILTPLPFFRGSVVGLVNKLIAPQERYHDLLNRLVSSNSRDGMLAGLTLAAAAVNVEKPDPTSSTGSASSGRLASKVWAVLLEGGSVRGLGKQLGMRRRRKDGTPIYDEVDPMDKPGKSPVHPITRGLGLLADIRHLVLDIILPLVSTYAFHSHAKALLRPLYSNLEQDPPLTILRILTALWEAITGPSPGQGRKTALVLLDESALGHLVELFSRVQTEPSSGRTVAEMAQAFVEGVTTKPGRGVCFADEGWFPRKPREGAMARLGADDDDDREMHLSIEDKMRKGLHNRILSNVVRKLGGKVVDDNGRVGEWAVKVFEACPELVAGYWPNSALAVDPRLNARWIATMAYISSIVSLPCPDISTFRQPLPRGSTLELPPFRQQPPAVLTMIESILPSPLTKTHMTKGLSHADHLVQLVTAQTLARCLQKLSATRQLLRTVEAEVTRQPGSSDENAWSVCIRQLEMEARRRVPELMVVIAFAQKSAIMGQVAEDEEVDEAMASKSAMLTEAALRLFGLYHQAIPTITRDTKFDVGRLLVSSSSVKQERRERKDAKANAGSVIDEAMSQGSVGSMGSAGTAGMGGGFGYAKGDVKGFEALSQVHVLQLLGSVKGWQWINKASGSQYTYLYHILQLHLASHHPSTIQHTTALIRHLLLPTPLFDHDPSELDLWLSCLPRLPIGAGALGIIQQVHFLSFFDDCVRRCVKLPYRYLDEVTSTVAGYFNPQQLHTFPSILLMTMVEQWCAKVGGSHISSEAAGVVGHVIGRLLLGLVGKMRDMVFVKAVLAKMQGTLSKMRTEGKAKEGLEQLVQGVEVNLGHIDGIAQPVAKKEQVGLLAELLDEREYQETSFEYTASQLAEVDESEYSKLSSLIAAATPGSQARCARFAAQLLLSRSNDSRRRLLSLVKLAIQSCADATEAHRAKEAVFDSVWIKQALTSTDGDAMRDDVEALVVILDENDHDDQLVAEQFVIALEQGVITDKKGKRLIGTLDLTRPWARFFKSARASAVVAKLGQHADRLHGTRKGKYVELSPRVVAAIETLIGQCAEAGTVLKDLALWSDMGILQPVADVVQRSTSSSEASTPVLISSDTLGKLLSGSSTSAGKLIEALVVAYPSAAGALAQLLKEQLGVVSGRTELIPAIRALLDLPNSVDFGASGSAIANIAEAVLNDEQAPRRDADAAIEVLQRIIKEDATTTVTVSTFSKAHAQLAEKLAAAGEQSIVRSLLEEGLKRAISICASTAPLLEDQVALLQAITVAVRALSLEQVSLDGLLVESAITAITQDRLSNEAPVLLAAALIQRCDIKASFVRQQLSLLSSVSYYNTLSAPSTSAPTRLPFIRLYSALFHSSTYTSCQPNFVEPLLPLYTGSLHIADRLILGMWQTFESVRHLSVASILRNWSANGLSGLTGAGKALDALVSLDGGRVMATCINFPLRRTLGVQDQDEPQQPTPYGQTKQVKVKTDEPWGEQEQKGYDPVFVLNLLGGVLAASEVPPGKEQDGEERYGQEEEETQEWQYQLSGLDWVEIIRSDTLGVVVCALASRDAEMRRLAGHVLARVLAQIQDVTFHERDQLLYVLTLLQHATPNPAAAVSNTSAENASTAEPNGFVRSWDAPAPSVPVAPAPPRLPTMTTLFLAYHLHSLGSPSHFLYPLTSRFLLQRPVLDLYDPPMLYALLYGSDRGPRGELPSMQEVRRGRGWIVRLIRDGTRSEVDWSICRRRNVWALLSSMFRISVDINFRRLVLQTMESMALVPQAARTLVHKHCIFSWALLQFELSFTETNRASAEERERYVKLVELCVRGCVDGEMRKAAAAAKASATGEAGAITAAQPNGVKVPSVARSSSDSDSNDSESDSDSDSDEDEEERLADPLAGNEEEDTDPLMAPSKFTSEEHDNGAGKGSGGGKLLALLIEATKPRPDWLVDIETFIDGVVADADMSRLAALSRILLRLSPLSQAKETIAYSLPLITERLIAISPTANKADKPSPAEQETVENLFRAGLAMGEGESPVEKYGMDIARTRAALGEVIERVKRLEGEVGDWVRREIRIAGWEALKR